MTLSFILPPSLGNARTNARVEMLQGSMSSELGRDVQVRAAESYGELRDIVLKSQVDIAWAPAAVVAEMTDAHLVLRAVREGNARYHSALITRIDRGVNMANLAGKKAVWVDPYSVGGHLLAVAWLRSQGIEPNLVFAEQRFLGSHRAVVDAILDGSADVSAVSVPSMDPAQLEKSMAFFAGIAGPRLAVIGVTDSAPTDAIVLTTKMQPTEADRVGLRLLNKRGRSPSSLLSAMEAERLERTELTDYRELGSLLWRRTMRPPPR